MLYLFLYLGKIIYIWLLINIVQSLSKLSNLVLDCYFNCQTFKILSERLSLKLARIDWWSHLYIWALLIILALSIGTLPLFRCRSSLMTLCRLLPPISEWFDTWIFYATIHWVLSVRIGKGISPHVSLSAKVVDTEKRSSKPAKIEDHSTFIKADFTYSNLRRFHVWLLFHNQSLPRPYHRRVCLFQLLVISMVRFPLDLLDDLMIYNKVPTAAKPTRLKPTLFDEFIQFHLFFSLKLFIPPLKIASIISKILTLGTIFSFLCGGDRFYLITIFIWLKFFQQVRAFSTAYGTDTAKAASFATMLSWWIQLLQLFDPIKAKTRFSR